MRNCLYGFEIYLVNVKTIRTIVQIFVAFSEKLNKKYVVSYIIGIFYTLLIFMKICDIRIV